MAEKSLEFGSRLDEIRNDKGLTQQNLADLVGIKQPTISSYINDGRIPEAPILFKLSKVLDISMEDLLVGKQKISDDSPVQKLRRIDDFLAIADERYLPAKKNLDLIFKSDYDDVKKAITSNLEVFAGTVKERYGPSKKKASRAK
jgi:transcriptional regulator with XRE-family HTH domain